MFHDHTIEMRQLNRKKSIKKPKYFVLLGAIVIFFLQVKSEQNPTLWP